jgi:proteasome inhibitor subunit 1 (PI31)
MTNDVLDAAAITQLLPGLLPASSKNLASCHDALAALFHTAMSAVGFRLVGIDELSPPSSTTIKVLPDKWDAHGPGHYTFRYLHDQSSLDFVMKVAKLGGRTIVNAIAAEVCLLPTRAPHSPAHSRVLER